uniref:PD-(D/E)XK nuclease family transposase n=1 Tax=Candidatus Kentrum sp. MB TaxID=2138164 RepID=A0A450XG22_9GAMM|nr:MAG: hypothetical protein BECKMB1821G_GA0114241_10357 [Candidatus Kentron sp. MB]VFK32553.1 MAG: hypothetical protein BECKMB1821I_GA0114274_103428 [Candidatus Kentron sp. MB]VFK75975.1 MAG: hypothetical protein BECKMB1821H_GA0114242_103728 [Candidatus Kentron sp. MB]
MHIANPIYNVVFKHLIQNEKLATLILSTILEQEIVALDFPPQETYVPAKNRPFTVYRLGFSAQIKAPDGQTEHVLIEIQKANLAADIMRYRSYLNKQYINDFAIARNGKIAPVISIYFLGHRLERANMPIIQILRNCFDITTGETVGDREEFIESIIIQIPYLGIAPKTDMERLLAVFDQERKIKDNAHILDIDENTYPEKYRQIIHWLNQAISDPEIKRAMEEEDRIAAETEDPEDPKGDSQEQ